jgi:hypothetical protein
VTPTDVSKRRFKRRGGHDGARVKTPALSARRSGQRLTAVVAIPRQVGFDLDFSAGFECASKA